MHIMPNVPWIAPNLRRDGKKKMTKAEIKAEQVAQRKEEKEVAKRFDVVRHLQPNRAQRRLRERAGYNVSTRRNVSVESPK